MTAQKLESANYAGQISAISKAQAVIEFNLDGTIITANENFLKTVGYTLEEVKGKHHQMFVDEATRNSAHYKRFWDKLNRGEYDSGEYKRMAKGGREIWIQASYNPIFDLNGNAYKVVKFATDVTAEKIASANYEGQIIAIDKAQAVIEFNLDGTIIKANDNFLTAMGYTLDEIQGKHHSMFVDDKTRNSQQYLDFWAKLKRGEYDSGEYKRFAKGGREVWINASYNPIIDLNGTPFKVVKFAADVTAEKIANANYEGQISAIDKSQAVIEFNMDGTIITANENFLAVTGYTLNEIKGRHHQVFVEDAYKMSGEYREFWEGLNRGEYHSGEYQRVGKGGKEIWIQASYNPIFDLNSKPFKVVKYATDVTAQKKANDRFQFQVTQIGKVAEAVALGDLSTTVEVKSNDDKLGIAVNQMVDIFRGIVSQANTIAQGDYSSEISLRSEKDELGKALFNMTETLREVVAQANRIANGDYDNNIEPRSDKDELGKALFTMTNNLRDFSRTSEIENWVKTGIAGIGDLMRGEKSLEVLTDKIITYLSEYVNAMVGVFYLMDDDGVLQMAGSYAFTVRKHLNTSIKMGEGLVGQAAKQKKTIMLQQVPDDYICVSSALGESVPRNIIVVPLLSEKRVEGVIELGTLEPMDSKTIKFVESITDSIGLAILSVKDVEVTERLLEKSQIQGQKLKEQTEEMEAQQEELRQANEELKVKSEEMAAQQEELRVSNEELSEKSEQMQAQQEELRISNAELITKSKQMEKAKNELEQQKEKLQGANSDLEESRKELDQRARG